MRLKRAPKPTPGQRQIPQHSADLVPEILDATLALITARGLAKHAACGLDGEVCIYTAMLIVAQRLPAEHHNDAAWAVAQHLAPGTRSLTPLFAYNDHPEAHPAAIAELFHRVKTERR